MTKSFLRASLVATLLALAPLGACDETIDAVPAPARQTSEAGADSSPLDADVVDAVTTGLPFKACPGAYSGACIEFSVPLDWAHPEGKSITLFVDKISTSPKAKGQLWLLQGGPGGTGADMVPIALQIAAARSDLDIYTLDHRGVGRSTRLGCANEGELDGGVDAAVDASDDASLDATTGDAADAGDAGDAGPIDAGEYVSARSEAALRAWQPCLDSMVGEWGAGLAQFNTTNAARDLAFAIDQIRKPGEAVYVYGASYGTYWAHRYLQVAPNAPTGVILDSIVPPDGEFFSNFASHFDLVGQKLAEMCKSDAICSSHLGPDPWAKLQSIRAKIGTGHCPELPMTDDTRDSLVGLLMRRDTQGLALATLYRYDRCSPEDVAALKVLRSKLAGLNPRSPLFSQMLYFNVAFSELWETPAPSLATLHARGTDGVFGGSSEDMFALQARWPKYAPDAFVRAYANTTVPMLMLNGTLDAQTPIETASLMQPKFTAPHQTFVTIPTANHGTLFQSPVKTEGEPPCGFTIMMSFLDDPTVAPNLACLNDLASLSFNPPSSLGNAFFGTPNIWTGAPTTPESASEAELANLGWHYPTY
jgi:pimeloyl-ACP methyl ester carboxylesterase